jgi:hypothetical protein
MKLRSLEFLAVILLFSCYPEEKFFEAPGKVRKISVFFEQVGSQTDKYFYYNDLGDLIKETWKGQGQEEGMDILYTYNSKGQLIRKQSKIQGNQYTDNYTYDDAGRLINRSLGYDYFYDENGSLSRIWNYTSVLNGVKTYYSIYQYTYDSMNLNRISSEKYYILNGANPNDLILEEHLEYKYDEEGYLVQKKLVDGAPKFYRETKEFYQYDADGRLYKMLVYNLDQYFYPGLDATHTYYYYE